MDLRFQDPFVLLLLFAVPVLAVVSFWLRLDAGAIPMGSISSAALSHRTWRVRFEPWLPALRLMAVTALIVAMARPQRGEAVAEDEGEGIDIILAYDVSSSMSEQFARGQSRQEAAESVLRQFVDARTTDRVGLVVFRGNALTLSPLTTDFEAVGEAISLAPSIRLEDDTAIGSAIAEAVNALRSSESASRIIILLTDGDSNAGAIEPLAAARLAETLGVRVYTVGVVSQLSGQTRATINVDETALRQIAEVTGGTYNRAQDPAALQQIYDTIDELEKSRFADIKLTRYDELAPWLLAFAALMLTIELLARSTWFRRSS